MSDSWPLLAALYRAPTLRTLYLWGPPGIGKTYSAYRDGLNGRNVYAVTLTEDTPAAELRGHFLPKGQEFIWHHGPLCRAMLEGARLVLNEVSHAGPDVQSLLHVALESPETARLTLPTGETIRPVDGFQVVLTDNVPPTGLAAPIRDRLDAVIQITTPPAEAIAAFPQSMQAIVVSAAKLEGERRVSLRKWEALARLMNGGLSLHEAGQAAFGPGWSALSASISMAMGAAAIPAPEPAPAAEEESESDEDECEDDESEDEE